MILVIILSIILSVFILLLGVISYASAPKQKVNKYFFLMVIFMTALVLIYMPSVYYSQNALFLTKLTDVFALLASCMFLIFSQVYPKTNYPKICHIISIINLAVSFVLLPIILFTNLVVESIKKDSDLALPKNGYLATLYFVIIIVFILISIFTLFYKYFKEYSLGSKERYQLKYVLLGFGISGIVLVIMMLIIASLPQSIISQYGALIEMPKPFSLIIFVSFTSYGILKGGLFDVRTAIVRSVTYSLVLATMAGIYVGTTSLLSGVLGFGQSGPAELAGNVVISLVLVMIFQPLKRFFDKITNRIFYKDNYNTDEFFGRLNKTLAVTTDLRSLLERTSTEIGKTLKSSQTFFYINSENGRHISAGTSNHSVITKTDADEFTNIPKPTDGVIVASLLDDGNIIKEIMTSHKIEIVLPLIQDGKTIGYLCLGEHLSSNYTTRDIKVLDTISNELIIAIQNALSVQEIRDFNITLKREIAIATQELRIKNALLKKLDKAKDEFVSMASHQLRTPLTSVKGYLSMVVEGDAGKVSKQQKQLLDEAYSSNEKMVHLVNDFLNVSRIQTGKFMLDKVPTDLSKVVTEEIDGLRQNAKTRNLNLILNVPKKLPILNIDEGKIRQVVMNFADNALYYSNANTDIHIDLVVDGDEVVYTVKDTGIGVPVSEQGQLFTKFYRASNARKQRPDGTGVGLYLAKKIVTAHDGKIVFQTVEGKGSTFGFRLPIKELELSAEKEIKNLKD